MNDKAAIKKQLSCFDPLEGLMPVADAIAQLQSTLDPVSETESLPIEACLGRYLAEEVFSCIDVPGYTNSAMDGYAIGQQSIPADGDIELDVIGTAWAGKPFPGCVENGQAVQIMTGAVMPNGADTVVINEHVELRGDRVRIDSDVKPEKNVRIAGEDIRQGDSVLVSGVQLMPAHIGLLASLGVDRCRVFRKLKVAFLSTGDELLALSEHAGSVPGEGRIFDSNRYTLQAMLARTGVEIKNMGLVGDQLEATQSALENAADWADVVISSGGASAGDADFIGQCLQQMGPVGFWKLAMRPGRPLAYCRFDRPQGPVHFFGLPGNPVAVMVTFYQFVKPALECLACGQWRKPILYDAIADMNIRKSAGRMEYQRGMINVSDTGEIRVSTTGKQGAGRLSSMAMANCFIVLESERGDVKIGDRVKVQPFDGLV